MSLTAMKPAADGATTPAKGSSSLRSQIEHTQERTPTPSFTRSPSKPRSLSDAPKPSLSPSPAFREPARVSKDDTSTPTTPRRPNPPARGLSLQMPLGEINGPGATGLFAALAPLSPKLDSSHTYGAPASMLPRRSRGLDYTRACTNLHHSTLAESSPDSSPTITGRGMQMPQRRSLGNTSTSLDSQANLTSSIWSTVPAATERTTLSSSVSSVTMLDSDSDGSSSSDGDLMDRDVDDPILNTPHVSKLCGNIVSGAFNSPGGEWMGNQCSPAAASLMSFQRGRFRKRRSQHSSSSGGTSSKQSPGPLSPPLMKSIESTNGSYFGPGLTRQQVQSRRESLSLGTNDLHLSDSEEGESKANGSSGSSGNVTGASSADGPRGVIRRAVTRRGNLLPKTKTFARIRAALLEEAAPIDSEAKREAEVIHQVRESDPTVQPTTSPILQSSIPFTEDPLEHNPDDDITSHEISTDPISATGNFSRQVERNSGGLRFWNTFDDRHRTPPPPQMPRGGSSGMSDENMGTPPSSMNASSESVASRLFEPSRSRSSTPMASNNAPTAADVARKVNNKRRRDDDFDPASFKRRAVSPGMSVQNSPVLPQSPIFADGKPWGHPPPKTNGHGDRSNSGSSGNGMKRVGLQGMTETNDGLMNMSID